MKKRFFAFLVSENVCRKIMIFYDYGTNAVGNAFNVIAHSIAPFKIKLFYLNINLIICVILFSPIKALIFNYFLLVRESAHIGMPCEEKFVSYSVITLSLAYSEECKSYVT